jgi:hypothetical protein
MTALAQAHNASQRRIAELEDQVAEMRQAIELGAGALGLYEDDDPVDVAKLLDRICTSAEATVAMRAETKMPELLESIIANAVAARRRRVEAEFAAVLHLAQQS